MLKAEIWEQIRELVKLAIKKGITLQEMQMFIAETYNTELCIHNEQFVRAYKLNEQSVQVAKATLQILQENDKVKRYVPQNLDWQAKFITILAMFYEEKQKGFREYSYKMFLRRVEEKLELTHAEFLSILRSEIRFPLMVYIETLWKSKGFYWRSNTRTEDVFECFYNEVMKTLS